jgi:glutamate-1-semialdehyde 2,1-aminomutase
MAMSFEKSRQLYERSRKSLAGGVSSNVRLAEKPVPLFFQRGKGSRLYDVDSNEYIDYMLGQGPDIFGHAPDFLVDAVSSATQSGITFAGQHELEIRVSETIQRLVPSAELVRYASSGTEVVQAALRLARAYTGRSKYIKFEGQYHGWVDSVLYSTAPTLEQAGPYASPNPAPMSAGMATSTANDIIVLPWNDIDLLTETLNRHHEQVAAIITEPVMCNTNCIMPEPGYLEEMRRLCDERGIVLIFDEVITGFRLALGGAQELMGITPDLTTFAKAMAGGFPIAAVAGKREIMDLMAEGRVMHGGTVNGNIMSLAATEASLQKLMENDGAAIKQLYSTGRALMEGLRERAARHEIEVLVQGPGPAFAMAFTDTSEITDYRSHLANADTQRYARFCQGMLERGVRLIGRGIWFVSTAHTEEDIERTLTVADEVFATL